MTASSAAPVFLGVFGKDGNGGNPVAVLRDLPREVTKDLPGLARHLGMSVAVVANERSLRFASTAAELSMCGHGCLGAAWMLTRDATAPVDMTLDTPAGPIACRRDGATVSIGLPMGTAVPVSDAASRDLVQRALGLASEDMHELDLLTAGPLRPKTLVALRRAKTLETLSVRSDLVREACARLNSTGLYPFARARVVLPIFAARQFPASGGEDAATGTAAAALMSGLLHWRSDRLGEPSSLCVEQGEQISRPCRLIVEADWPGEGSGRVWLSGRIAEDAARQGKEMPWPSI